ncbi:MAG: rRNA pseudouridine synthase [Streptosporangiales bacterium]|nr:rRNA pseudouridine synthase [Streptosporangiales bacterium]
MTEPVRLQRVLARAGFGSRRSCEDLIAAGRVSVDGDVAHLGDRVDVDTAVVRVDGLRIPSAPELVYLVFNKPMGVVSTMDDPQGRPTLADYVADRPERLFHVGRLDAATEGLLLLTNDGDLAHRLAHPRYSVPKTYVAEVRGSVARDLGPRLREGVELDDGPAAVDEFTVLERGRGRTLVRITLHEGRNRIVRRMLAAVEHPVERLVRTDVGPVSLGDLPPGTLRDLTTQEVGRLYQAVAL